MQPLMRKIVIAGVCLAVAGSGVAAAELLGGSDGPRIEGTAAGSSSHSDDQDERSGKDGGGAAKGSDGSAAQLDSSGSSAIAKPKAPAPPSTCTMSPIQLVVPPTVESGTTAEIDATASYVCGPGPVTVRISASVVVGGLTYDVSLANPDYVLQGSSVLAQTALVPIPEGAAPGTYVVTVRATVGGIEIARGSASVVVVDVA